MSFGGRCCDGVECARALSRGVKGRLWAFRVSFFLSEAEPSSGSLFLAKNRRLSNTFRYFVDKEV